MWIKAGVSIKRLNREIRRTLPVANEACAKIGGVLLITSCDEGNHGAGSLHYSDDAYDFVCVGGEQGRATVEVRSELGKDFDVVLEVDHVHVEYDPKK